MFSRAKARWRVRSGRALGGGGLDLAGELRRAGCQPDEAAASEGLERLHGGGDDDPAGGGGLVELDGVGRVGQRREAKGDDLDVEARAKSGHLPVGPLAVEDDVGQARRLAHGALQAADDLESSSRAEARPARASRRMSNHSSTAPTYPTVRPPARGAGSGIPAKRSKSQALGSRRVAGFARPPTGAAAIPRSRRPGRPTPPSSRSASASTRGPVRRELLVRVEAVVDDPPPEALAGGRRPAAPRTATRRAGRRPSRPKRSRAAARLSNAPAEGAVLEPAVAGVLPTHAGNGQERDARRHAHGLSRARPSPRERPVEDAHPAARQGLGELLGPLPPVAPGDDGQDDDVGTAGLGRGPARSSNRGSSTGGLRMPSSRSGRMRRRRARRHAIGRARRPKA